MRWAEADIYIAGTAAILPSAVAVSDAVSQGWCPAAKADESGQVAVTVAPDDEAAPDLARMAAVEALRSSGLSGRDIALLLHSVVLHDGLDAWHVGAYILDPLGASPAAPPLGLRGTCAGAVASIELACSYLKCSSERAAVLTAADKWLPEMIDRWVGSPAVFFGDGAASVILAVGTGFAKVLATASFTDTGLEGACRGDDPFGCLTGHRIDFAQRGEAFRRAVPGAEIKARSTTAVQAAIATATKDAGVGLDDIRWIAAPFVVYPLLKSAVLDPLGIDDERTTWDIGRDIGHLGAADPFVGLHRLVELGRVEPGDHVILLGIGGDCMWSAAVLRIAALPDA